VWVLLSFLCLFGYIQGQVVYSTLTGTPAIFRGGDPFTINGAAAFGQTSITPLCTVSANLPIAFVGTPSLYAGCVIPPQSPFTSFLCNITDYNFALTTFQNFTLFNATINTPTACVGSNLNISLTCTGNLGRPSQSNQGLVNSSSSDLAADMTDDAVLGNAGNLTNVPVIDFNQNKTTYSINATVTNIGSCTALNITCTIVIPTVLNVGRPDGLVTVQNRDFINNFTSCALLIDTFTCHYDSLPTGAAVTVPIVLRVENNGVLNTTMQCTSIGIINLLGASDNIIAYSINIPPPPSSGSIVASSSSSDVIINVVIPLSVFGGVMIILLCAIAITVAVFVIIKKIRSDEDVGF